MTRGLGSDWTTALAAAGITTVWLARMDFKSGTERIWTGQDSIAVSGTGDTLLDGGTFHSLTPGVAINWGDNSIGYGGSDALAVGLAIPAVPPETMVNASIFPDEYQGRLFVLWRGILITAPTAFGTPAVWAFRRIRTGLMDSLTIRNDGDSHLFSLGIESHQAAVSGASGQTYLSQPQIDAVDTSQRYAANIQNGKPAPATGMGPVWPGFQGRPWQGWSGIRLF
jgi:hypothetical protein